MDTVAEMVEIFDDHGFADTSESTKLVFLNDTIGDFCSREPWPFLETSINLTFDGVSSVPSNLPAELRAPKVTVDANTTRIIQPERVETIEKGNGALVTATGDPLFYYFIGSELRFAPIPPSTFVARMTHLQHSPEVDINSTSADILVPTRNWMILVFGTLQKLYDMEDDPELSARMEQHYEARIQQVRESLWRRQLDRPDHIVISDPDYYDYD